MNAFLGITSLIGLLTLPSSYLWSYYIDRETGKDIFNAYPLITSLALFIIPISVLSLLN